MNDSKRIDIRELELELENADNFKEVANNYFQPKYSDDGEIAFELRPGIELVAPPVRLGGRPHLYSLGKVGNWLKDWVIECERKNRRRRYLKMKQRDGAVRIVAEGDSWFQHPLVSDIIDWIEKNEDYAVLSLARAGDELRDMVDPGEYLLAIDMEKPKYFLVSAGGNDFLGNIGKFLQKPDAADAEVVSAYIQPSFDALLAEMGEWLVGMLHEVLNQHVGIHRVVIHGYDYAIPCRENDDRSGKWLGHAMRNKGITDYEVQCSIVKEMVDRFNFRLHELAAMEKWQGRVSVVDFRGTLTEVENWYDEIHPKSSRNKLLAERIIAAF